MGNVQEVNIRKAGEILEKIPDNILATASKKTEVIPTLYSLIIAGSKETKLISAIQERIVSEKHGKELSIKALKNKTDVMRQLDISLRLPLLNLIIPYIKQLSENEREKVARERIGERNRQGKERRRKQESKRDGKVGVSEAL